MGQLREVIKTLKAELARSKGSAGNFSKELVKDILRKYDAAQHEYVVPWATEAQGVKRLHPRKGDTDMRIDKPGKFDVVYVNSHTKERQILTRKDGVTYDVAWHYFQYITFSESETFDEFGYYEIQEHVGVYLPEEQHFGL